MSRTLKNILTGAITVVFTLLFVLLLDRDDWTWRFSMATAYTSMALIVLVLSIGPFNVLFRARNSVSSNVRRDIGICAGIYAILHVVFGLQVHLRGKMWQYFIYPDYEVRLFPFRIDPFGLANYVGLVAGMILIVLMVLSNNASIRRLGLQRWKRYQRANYVAALLILGHGIVYQILEKRSLGFVITYLTLALLAIGWQAAGFRRVRSRSAQRKSGC